MKLKFTQRFSMDAKNKKKIDRHPLDLWWAKTLIKASSNLISSAS